MNGIPRTFPGIKIAAGSIGLLCLGASLASMLAGCTETTKPQPNIIQRLSGQTPQGSVPAGFFGADQSLLKPGGENQAALIYVNPDAGWSRYDKVLLEPVQFWDSANSSVSVEDQQQLTTYFYNKLKENLEKNFTLTDRPGPGVMALQVALVNVSAATPGLRSASLVIPQVRLLNTVQSLATGSYAFVGSAEVAGKITDSQTGALLAAAVDERRGGTSVTAAAQWQWGDAENIMNLWARTLAMRLEQWKSGTSAPQPQP
ncbi:MAG: DUF3313 domain-containing protein [Candidatus Binataceae bacterium]